MKRSLGIRFLCCRVRSKFHVPSAAVACLVLFASGRVDAAGQNHTAASGEFYQVQAFRNIPYQEIPHDRDPSRHHLDVYCPKGQTGGPVLFFVHGGGWTNGSKDEAFGIYNYGAIARCFAERGLIVVAPNYRLSPNVKHPEHIKDVARAFAWTYENIARFGGDRNQIFVAGHSAGGHLVSLLATDPTYLQREGRSAKDIRGVIAISGVYRLEDLDLNLPFTSLCKCMKLNPLVHPFASVFGTDPEVIKQASPINHVRPGLPPFLLLSAWFDYTPLREMTKDFAAALAKNYCEVAVQVIPWRTHETLIFDIVHQTAEPRTIEAVVQFILRCRSRPHR